MKSFQRVAMFGAGVVAACVLSVPAAVAGVLPEYPPTGPSPSVTSVEPSVLPTKVGSDTGVQNNSGSLPNTGADNLQQTLYVGGLLLLIGGAVLTVTRRRRHRH